MKKFTALLLTFIISFVALGSMSANAAEVPKETQIQKLNI